MGTTYHQRILPWKLEGTLPMPPDIHLRHKAHKSLQHSVLQTQVSHMPTITPEDALIKAADNLVDTISGVIPRNSITEDAVLQLMAICR